MGHTRRKNDAQEAVRTDPRKKPTHCEKDKER